MSLSNYDQRRIVDTLRLWRPGLHKFPTQEDYEREKHINAGWHQLEFEGSVFGPNWTDYTVVIVGWELMGSQPPGWYMPPDNPLFGNWDFIGDTDRPIIFCGVRIYYKKSHAFAEILIESRGTIDSIQNAQDCNNPAEISKVWRGFELFKYLQKCRGPRSEYNDRETLLNCSIEAYCKVCNRQLVERCTMEDVAQELLISKGHLYELYRSFGITPKVDVAAEARRRLSNQRAAALTVG